MLRWIDGFDYYAAADFSSQYNIVGGTFSISSAGGRFGSGALTNGSSGGNEQLVKFFDTQTVWVVGFSYKFNTGGKANFITSLQLDGNAAILIKMNTSNQLQITNAAGTVLATGTISLLTNTFYYIEYKCDLAAGNVTVRVNGVDEVQLTAGTPSQASANRVVLHYDDFHITNTWDDYYICDGTGSDNNSFLGDMRIETLVASAVGPHQDWSVHGAGGDPVAAIAESTEDGDTSYIFSSTVNHSQTYNFPDLSSVPSAIAGIKLTAICRKDDAGVRGITPILTVSGVDHSGSALGVGDSYSYLVSIVPTNPGTAAAWTGADLNALIAGWNLST